jgi:hypothetical protein
MPIIQILLLFVLVGGLSLLVLQNLSPVLPIVFLGMKTPALPVAAWILGALAAGFFTSLCLQLFSYLPRRSLLARIRQLEAEPSPTAGKRRENEQTASRYSTPPPQPETPTSEDTSEEWDSDWEVEEAPEDDEWEFDEEPKRPSRPETVIQEPREYEVKQEPKSRNVTGSIYSYSYREPSSSGAGRTEAVYDANYRVITPPYRDSNASTRDTSNQEEEDDWGFEDDDSDDVDESDRESWL